MRMTFTTFCLATVLCLFSGCLSQTVITHEVFYEVRAAKRAHFQGLTRIIDVDEVFMVSTGFSTNRWRQEDGFTVYADSVSLGAHRRLRRAVIFGSEDESKLSQVFVLPIPPKPKAAGWSDWRRPDYLEGRSASGTFMDGTTHYSRTTNIPPDCLEFRYRVVEERFR